MASFHLIPQAFSVVPGYDNNRFIQQSFRLQCFQNFAEIKIHIGNFAVVGMVSIIFFIRRRGIIRQMRVKIMYPAKKLIPIIIFQPGRKASKSGFSPPLGIIGFKREICLEGIIIVFKSAVQAESRVNRKGGNKGRCLVTPGRQNFGNGFNSGC